MTWGVAAKALFASRVGYDTRVFVWVQAKDLTGAAVNFGYWSGERDRTFDLVGDGARAYYGVGSAMDTGTEHYQIGTSVSTRTISMDVNPNAEALIRQHNVSFAPITIHHALFRSTDGSLVEAQQRYLGFINKVSLTTSVTGVSQIRLELVSAAQRGVLTVSGSKSNASQIARSATDTFRRDADLGAVADDVWGGVEQT